MDANGRVAELQQVGAAERRRRPDTGHLRIGDWVPYVASPFPVVLLWNNHLMLTMNRIPRHPLRRDQVDSPYDADGGGRQELVRGDCLRGGGGAVLLGGCRVYPDGGSAPAEGG